MALIGALEARYPVVRRLVGDDFFRGMAGAYVAAEKPRTPALIHYGVNFADFVAHFPPAAEIAFLADVARLENAWIEAYHAADADAVGIDDIAGRAPEAIEMLRLRVHPAARCCASPIPPPRSGPPRKRKANRGAREVWAAEQALVTRPDADVFVRALPPGGFAFAEALFSGATLGEAAAHCAGEDFDPGAHLVGLIEAGTFQSLI